MAVQIQLEVKIDRFIVLVYQKNILVNEDENYENKVKEIEENDYRNVNVKIP